MNEEQKLLYIKSQILCAEIEMQGMLALNKEREMKGFDELPYKQDDFENLINKYNIHHNGIITEIGF